MYKIFQCKILPRTLSKSFLNKTYEDVDNINLVISPAPKKAFFYLEKLRIFKIF